MTAVNRITKRPAVNDTPMRKNINTMATPNCTGVSATPDSYVVTNNNF